MVDTATPPATNSKAPAFPFPIASRMATRFSFATSTATLGSSTVNVSPIAIPAVGYIRYITLEVTLTGTGGTTPAFTADAPFNALSQVEFRSAAGNDLYVPMDGYKLYLANKYSAMVGQSPFSDARYSNQYSATAPSAHFYLTLAFELDPETGLGSIPALAGNRTYQLVLSYAPISTFLTGSPSVTGQINATVHYWTEPPAISAGGVAQDTAPFGLGTISQWSLDTPPLTPGDKRVTLSNKSGILRTIIFVLRNSSGARIGGSDWPAVSEFSVDNDTLFYLPKNDWQWEMQKAFGFPNTALDTAGALDTGVYVLPFHALAGGIAGDPANSRSQLLPTIDASQLVLRGTSWGSNASTLEIITQSVIPSGDPSVVYSK